MKKLILTTLVVIVSCYVFSQVPEGFNYQAVVRGSGGQEITDQTVGIQISLIQYTADGSAVYIERFTPTTNEFGLVNLVIGIGDVQSGTFSTIDWSDGPYFIKVEIDENGLTSYVHIVTSQLLSVPYALYAKNASSYTETDPAFNAWNKNYNDLINKPIIKDSINAIIDTTSQFVRTTDYEEYNLENLIDNSSFEIFSSGDDTYPDNWSLLGEEDEDTFINRFEPGYFGSSAIKITDYSVTKNNSAQQEIYPEGNLPTGLLNETVTLSVWAKKDAASGLSIGEIAINDGSNRTVFPLSDSHDWNRVSLNHVIASDASKLVVELWPTSNSAAEIATYIFDGVMLTTGPYNPAFALNTTDILSLGGYATIDMNNEKIYNLADPTEDQDAATKKYSDDNDSKKYAIGDFAQGGIVFWVDESAEHGLVCSKNDQSTGARWYAGTYGNTQAKGDGPYAGEVNTSIIIAAHAAIGDDGSTYAARICNELQITEEGITYGDWYLPSKYEFSLLYENRAIIAATAAVNDGVGFSTLTNHFYWSSTEDDANNAWRQSFDSGVLVYSFSKSNEIFVRAIRAF